MNPMLPGFIPHGAEYRDVSNSKMLVAFGMIFSVIAFRPVALGKHESSAAFSASTRAAAPLPA